MMWIIEFLWGAMALAFLVFIGRFCWTLLWMLFMYAITIVVEIIGWVTNMFKPQEDSVVKEQMNSDNLTEPELKYENIE